MTDLRLHRSPVRAVLVVAALGAFLLVGCRNNSVQQVHASIQLSPTALAFERVKVATAAELTFELASRSRAPLEIQSVTVKDGAQGGAEAFEVISAPSSVPGLESSQVTVRFKPTEVRDYGAVVEISSTDPDHPVVELALSGTGDHPRAEVVPVCETAAGCAGTASTSPPALDFGEEPFARALELPVPELPRVEIRSTGAVPLGVTRLEVVGPDAAAFVLAEGPSLGEIAPAEKLEVPVRFKPTSEVQKTYAAELVVGTDDPALPEARVSLSGELRANLPPVVCANIIRIEPGDGSPAQDYDRPEDWSPLLVAPPSGYDFSEARDVQPGTFARATVLTLSAQSSPDPRTCSSDPEDGRLALNYRWEVTAQPSGAATALLTTPDQPITQLVLPNAAGAYEVALTVTDFQGNATTVPLRFSAVLKRDLVVELSWSGQGGFEGVDLDLHLVRPSSSDGGTFGGAFSFFDEGSAGRTSGDLNGYAAFSAGADGGYDFEWGEPGGFDDPVMNLDDTGSGQLIESISLNYPENDPACATDACAYKLMVHYFRDGRSHTAPEPCTVGSGCVDGDACDCSQAGTRCVAGSAPSGSPATGSGACFAPPQPLLRIFLRGEGVPAAEIPLGAVVLPAPCQMLYAADVVWPSQAAIAQGNAPDVQIEVKGADASGQIVSPVIGRFGVRHPNSLACSPNVLAGTPVPWFTQEP